MFYKFNSVPSALDLLALPPSSAQEYPSNPINIVPKYAPGGSDLFGRLFAKHLFDTTGQSSVVKDLPGAGGTIGYAQVARALAMITALNHTGEHKP